MAHEENKQQHVGKAVARGAAWTMSIHFINRGIAIVSTLILARLLTPVDFGLYALGMSVYALIELLGAFGFGVVLIQNQDAGDEHYHTAWTLNFIFSILCAVALYLAAPLAADLLREDKLIAILRFTCLLFLVDALKNIGIINFQKEMVFDREFRLKICVKLAGFLVTIPIALITRSYWAMLCGLLASSMVLVIMSYLMHPFRPRFSLSKWREMLGFSSWLQVNNLIGYVNRHAGRFVLARWSGVEAVGALQVARELGQLMLEIVRPINRAAFPGYASLNKNPRAMGDLYCDVMGMLLVVGLPMSAGTFLLAEFLVPLLLGEKWLSIVWLVQLFSMATLLQVLNASVNQLLVARGKVQWATGLMVLRLVMFLGALFYFVPDHAAAGVIYSRLFVWGSTLFLAFYTLRLAIDLQVLRLLTIIYRPVIATAAMCLAILAIGLHYTAGDPFLPRLLDTIYLVAVGISVYAVALLTLWSLVGRPAGAEKTMLKFVDERVRLRFFSSQGAKGG